MENSSLKFSHPWAKKYLSIFLRCRPQKDYGEVGKIDR